MSREFISPVGLEDFSLSPLNPTFAGPMVLANEYASIAENSPYRSQKLICERPVCRFGTAKHIVELFLPSL
jgi:hypothetical protein